MIKLRFVWGITINYREQIKTVVSGIYHYIKLILDYCVTEALNLPILLIVDLLVIGLLLTN